MLRVPPPHPSRCERSRESFLQLGLEDDKCGFWPVMETPATAQAPLSKTWKIAERWGKHNGITFLYLSLPFSSS